MDALVHDFNTALDETAGSNSSERSLTGRRKTWKRRCKSTSNLAQVGQNLSEDSSSSVDNFGLVCRDRGTSSLQFSDSDLEAQQLQQQSSLVRTSRNRLSRLNGYKKKKGILDPLALESDSFTENISPFKEFRVNSKRKRKFKRMAVDQSPENRKPLPQGFAVRSPGQGTKRKKVRSRSGCEARSVAKRGGVIPGKRKRSAREKSVEHGDTLLGTLSLVDTVPTTTATTTQVEEEGEGMELEEEERSSSSLSSSSEWEDVASDEGPPDNDGREADDEQSDWPGPEPGMSVMHLTDEEMDPEISFSQLLARRGSLVTARGRGSSAGRSSREIKAGTRRLRAATVLDAGRRLSHTDHVARFLQDPSSSSLHLTSLKPADRNLVLNLASLYSLSWTSESDTTLTLSKNNHLAKSGEFAVPGIPTLKHKTDKKKFEPKRQKRTPALSPVASDLRLAEAETSVGGRQRIKSGSRSS